MSPVTPYDKKKGIGWRKITKIPFGLMGVGREVIFSIMLQRRRLKAQSQRKSGTLIRNSRFIEIPLKPLFRNTLRERPDS